MISSSSLEETPIALSRLWLTVMRLPSRSMRLFWIASSTSPATMSETSISLSKRLM